MKSIQVLSFVCGVITASAWGVDLDVAGAKAKYEAQKAIATTAKARMDSLYTTVQQAEREVRNAEAQEANVISERARIENDLEQTGRKIQSLQSEIDSLNNQNSFDQRRIEDLRILIPNKRAERDRVSQQIEPLDRSIREIERQISNAENGNGPGQWRCVAVDHGFEEHSAGHPATGSSRQEAEAQAMATCLTFHGRCDIETCEKNSAELENLRRRLEQLQEEREIEAQKLRQLDSEISTFENEQNSLNLKITQRTQQIQNDRFQVQTLERERQQQNRLLADADERVRRARTATDFAKQNLVATRAPYLAAKSEYEYKQKLAEEAYAYYQQVYANYQQALNQVYAKADSAASEHSRLEASERATAAAKIDGVREGEKSGLSKGLEDLKGRDFRKGYQEGHEQGAIQSGLATFYQEGFIEGARIAKDKAHLESFPKGFNDTLKNSLSIPPPQSVTVDISESISSYPGGNSEFADLKNLPVGQGAEPSIVPPKEPVFSVPSMGTPQINVPASLKAYFNPPCTGLASHDLEPLCLERYEGQYLAQFAEQYRKIYLNDYQKGFLQSAESSYQAALQQQDNDALRRGKELGAKEQGILDGYAKKLASYQESEYQAGGESFKNEINSRAFIVLRQARITEISPDGLFTPGEKVQLELVIDNYGGEASALAKARVKVMATSGLGPVNFEIRELPALAAKTRTTLSGVVSSVLQTQTAGEKIKLTCVLEIETAQGWREIGRSEPQAETGFPVELTQVQLPPKMKVGEVVVAQFVFKNRTSSEITDIVGDLGNEPKFIKFQESKVQIPRISAGEEVSLPLRIEPGPWIGDNTFINVTSSLEFSGGGKTFQVLPRIIQLDRPVSLLLFDGYGQEVPSSTLKVKAGTKVPIFVQVKNRANTPLPGRYVLRAAKTSTPEIKYADGSTVSVDYGAISPGTQFSRVRINYSIPPSLKGKKEWAMVTLEGNGKVEHALMVYFDVQ